MYIVMNFNDHFSRPVVSNVANLQIFFLRSPAPALKREKTQSFIVVFLFHVNTFNAFNRHYIHVGLKGTQTLIDYIHFGTLSY